MTTFQKQFEIRITTPVRQEGGRDCLELGRSKMTFDSNQKHSHWRRQWTIGNGQQVYTMDNGWDNGTTK